VTSTTRQALRPADAVAGFLGAAACFLGAFELLYRPFRIAPLAVILLLVATLMSRDQQRIIRVGFALVGVCFVAGAAIQLLTHHPLF
jgi:hypothetical protein